MHAAIVPAIRGRWKLKAYDRVAEGKVRFWAVIVNAP